MIRDVSKLEPNVLYYSAICYMPDGKISGDPALFFNQKFKARRAITFSTYTYGGPAKTTPWSDFFIYFKSFDEIKILIEKLDREIYNVRLDIRDGEMSKFRFVVIDV